MDLQKHKFYVILGLILGAYVIFYAFFVSPLYSDPKYGITRRQAELSSIQKSLDQFLQPGKKIPNQSLIDYYVQKKANLEKAEKEIQKFFEDQDAKLESWFPEVEEQVRRRNREPEITFFNITYDGAKTALMSKVIEGPIQIGSNTEEGLSPSDVINFPEPAVLPSSLKNIQKKYWIIKGTLDILEKGGLRNLNTLNISENLEYIKGFADRRDVEIRGSIGMQDVPLLIQSFLNATHFSVVLKQVNVVRQKYNAPTKTLFVKWEDGKSKKERENEAVGKFESEKAEGKGAVPVDIHIKFIVVDYIQTKQNEGK